MPQSRFRPFPALLASLALVSCAGPRIESQTLQPPPPAANGGRPVSDPPPSRIVIHATIFREALLKKMAESLPRSGEGDAQLFAGQTLHYTWQREPLTIKFDRGRVVVGVPVHGRFNMLGDREMPITVTMHAPSDAASRSVGENELPSPALSFGADVVIVAPLSA